MMEVVELLQQITCSCFIYKMDVGMYDYSSLGIDCLHSNFLVMALNKVVFTYYTP